MVSEAKKAAQRRFAARHPEKIKAWEKGRSKDVRNAWTKAHRKKYPALALYRSCQQSAAKKGLEFTLTPEQVEKLVSPMVCSVSGIALTTEQNQGPWGPSIDRIDNNRGYTIDNVRLTCWMFNRAKAHWTEEDFMRMVRGICSTVPLADSLGLDITRP